MAAATSDRDPQRQPGDLLHYSGASGYTYYKGAMLMRTGSSGVAAIRPLTAAGSSYGRFVGVADNRVDLSAGLGSSQAIINAWATGEFTFAANGTSASSHIGLYAFALDDQTVGISVATPNGIKVGLITGIPTTSTYRVLINGFVGNLGSSTFYNDINP